jgi:hypothetical protein
MKRQNVSAMAKANGINPQTAHSRITKGWTAEAATATPARRYSKNKKKSLRRGRKADAVWAYVVANPLARPCHVSKATGASYSYVYKLMSKVGTPREVFEAEASVTEDVSLEQFVKDDTSPFPPTKLLVGVIIVAVLVAMVLFG